MKICTVSIVQVGKKHLAKIGEPLDQDSSKEKVFEKISEIINFSYINGQSLDLVFQENLPLFPNYEKEIRKHPAAALVYSYFFIKDRWKEAEKTIAKDKNCFKIYVSKVIKTRVLELEKKIITSPEETYLYCKNVFKRKKIPIELHNAMIGHAFSDPNNVFVKKYFKMKKVKI